MQFFLIINNTTLNTHKIIFMENSNLILTGYTIYLPIVIALTLFVSKTLFKNAQYYMLEIFHGKEEIALATNKLFEVGFYLLNIGFALFILEMTFVETPQSLVESLSVKIGGFSIYLGVILFLNLFLFMRGRKYANRNTRENMAAA